MTPATATRPRPPAPLRLHYPTLAGHAPVLRRGPDEIQVGLDPDTAVVLTGESFAELLARLDGTTAMTSVLQAGAAVGLSRRTVQATLRLLAAAGLVVDGQPPTASSAVSRVRLVGAGAVGRELARLLVEAGVVLYVYDEHAPSRITYPAAGLLPTRSQALASMLGASGEVRSVHHWSKPDQPVDLTIIVADGPEVDRVITDHLVRGDEPHLVLRTQATAGVVGPLVRPGRTACLHCHDLTRRRSDPQWPVVLEQLCRVELETDPVVAAWLAAAGAGQALAYLRGEPTDVESGTYEITAPGYRMQFRAWAAHPTCGCAWPGSTEWGA